MILIGCGCEEVLIKLVFFMKWLWKLLKEKKKLWCLYLVVKCFFNGKNGLINLFFKYFV